MTDNDVIMWAELCVNCSPAPCSACPFDEDTVTVDECMSKIIKELLEINKRQQAEIERLQKDKADIISAVEYRINQAKEFAYKEFAERLKGNIPHFSDGYTIVECVEGTIKYLVNELTGEPLTKVEHSSLCETETYKGDVDNG